MREHYSKCWCISGSTKYTTAQKPYPARLYTSVDNYKLEHGDSDDGSDSDWDSADESASRLTASEIEDSDTD